MLVVTTGGAYAAEVSYDHSDVLVVSGERDALQLLVDAVETLYGVETTIHGDGTVHNEFHVLVAREHFAQWVAQEVREYLTYSDFDSALFDSLGYAILVSEKER